MHFDVSSMMYHARKYTCMESHNFVLEILSNCFFGENSQSDIPRMPSSVEFVEDHGNCPIHILKMKQRQQNLTVRPQFDNP